MAATADIATAPRDGRVITVLQGEWQVPERAYWHPVMNGWVRKDDQQFVVLPNVTRWLDGSRFLRKGKPRK